MIEQPYLLFLGDVPDALAAKTAYGVVDWRREQCVGQMRLEGCQADTGLPDMSIEDAVQAGAKTMIVGAVNAGGRLPELWVASIVEAIEAGMHVASGLHVRLGSFDAIREAAERHDAHLHDVRHADRRFETGKGAPRSGLRLLTVGTDCSVGKKYTALALEKALRERGVDADFRATGQTGILIAGGGVPIDAVVADFISGAVESISPEADPAHWDIVEGQGSVFHPSFAGVSLGLLHGAQPDAFIVCHEPTRKTMRGVHTPLPSIDDVIEATVRHGRLTNPQIRPVGLSVNTAALGKDEAKNLLQDYWKTYGLPAVDPVRFGIAEIADHIVSRFRL
ncbi:MAG TPA: N-acetyltransferase DgcN [Afifellaceae bacterium]|nr:N-acetyltransferase DgcN [Afifellaceae bacterium]